MQQRDGLLTYELPMELKQIDLFRLESSTPLRDVRLHGISGHRHRVEHAVFCCGEDVFPERIRCEELALQKYKVSLQKSIRLDFY
jgi:hypothetical protein